MLRIHIETKQAMREQNEKVEAWKMTGLPRAQYTDGLRIGLLGSIAIRKYICLA